MNNSYYMELDKVVCRFFVTTGCRDGKSCLFPHVYTNGLFPDTVCRYFLKGECIFGKNCRYDHVILWKGSTTMFLCPDEDTPLEASDGFHTNTEHGEVPVMDTNSIPSCSVYKNIPNSFKPEKQMDMISSYIVRPEAYPEINYAEHHHHHLRISAKQGDLKHDRTDSLSADNEMPGPLKFSFEPCPYMERCPFQNNTAATGNAFQDKDVAHRCIELKLKTISGRRSLVLSETDYKTCGLCGRVVLHKATDEYCQFGLLQNCRHVFCLECILSFHGISTDRHKSIYSNLYITCPECHTLSRNVIPSRICMTSIEKEAVIKSRAGKRRFNS